MQCQNEEEEEEDFFPDQGRPFKVIDHTKEKRFGLVAKDLKEFITKACNKLDIPIDVPVRVVLESDGTEVEDDDYFNTLERNTVLMVLTSDQKWYPPGNSPRYRLVLDEPDGEKTAPKHLQSLVEKLHSDLTSITLLGGKELELLADMDPESVSDFFSEDELVFLETLKEASCRFLSEKQDAKDAMDLLKLYHCHHISKEPKDKATV